MPLPAPFIINDNKYFINLRDKIVEAATRDELLRYGLEVFDSLTDDVDVVITDHPSFRKCIRGKREQQRSPSPEIVDEPVQQCSKQEQVDQTEGSVCSTSTEVPSTSRARSQVADGKKMARLPPVLKEAYIMGLTIMPHQEFTKMFKAHQRKASLRGPQAVAPVKKRPTDKNAVPVPTKPKITRLRKPFIKIEDRLQRYRPTVEDLNHWPRINPNPERKGCIFADDRFKTKSQPGSSKSSMSALPMGSPRRKRRAARKLNFDKAQSTFQRKSESTGLSRTVESKHYDERRNFRPGYCELCECRAENMNEHLISEKHKKHFGSEIFQSLDEEIARGMSLDTFIAEALRRGNSERKGTTPTTSPSPRRNSARHTVSAASPRPSPRRQPTIQLASPRPSPRRQLERHAIDMRSPPFASPSRLRSTMALRSPRTSPAESPSSFYRLSFDQGDTNTPYITRILNVETPPGRKRVARNLNDFE